MHYNSQRLLLKSMTGRPPVTLLVPRSRFMITLASYSCLLKQKNTFARPAKVGRDELLCTFCLVSVAGEILVICEDDGES